LWKLAIKIEINSKISSQNDNDKTLLKNNDISDPEGKFSADTYANTAKSNTKTSKDKVPAEAS
jgi:hypothetical protein